MPRFGKSYIVAYLLWFFGGFFGAHRIYLNNPGGIIMTVLYIITAGFFIVGWLFDAFMIPVWMGHCKVNLAVAGAWYDVCSTSSTVLSPSFFLAFMFHLIVLCTN